MHYIRIFVIANTISHLPISLIWVQGMVVRDKGNKKPPGERIDLSQQILTPKAMMAFIAVLKEVLVNELATVLKDNTVDCGAESLSEKEQTLQKMLKELGQLVLCGW